MQVHRVAAPALAIGLALAGCAGGEDPLGSDATAPPGPEVTASALPAVTSFPSTGPLTQAEAAELAAAGVLLASDLPGWASATRGRDEVNDEADTSIKQCLGLPLQPYLAQDAGRTFTQNKVEVNSNVDVAASRVQTDAELAAFASPDGPRCYREYLATPGGGNLTVDLLPVSVAGADRAVAYRLALSGSGPTGPVQAGGFSMIVQVDQVRISLDTFELTGTPTFTLERLTDLAELSVGRVRAAGGSPSPTPTSYVTFIPEPSVPSGTPVRSGTATPTPSP